MYALFFPETGELTSTFMFETIKECVEYMERGEWREIPDEGSNNKAAFINDRMGVIVVLRESHTE